MHGDLTVFNKITKKAELTVLNKITKKAVAHFASPTLAKQSISHPWAVVFAMTLSMGTTYKSTGPNITKLNIVSINIGHSHAFL